MRRRAGEVSAITRPNGKSYRPRRAPSAGVMDDGDGWTSFVVVYRTHDLGVAYPLATPLLDEYDVPERLRVTPQLTWMREIPCSNDYSAHDRRWIDDPVRGIPCVVWEW